MKISVVMSVYNGERYLKQSIDSVLLQTYSNFEFIIINDGSTDSSLDIINSYQDKRIVLISRENKGLIYSLNQAFAIATGEYIARQDADDISEPDRFIKQIEYIRNQKLDFLGSSAVMIDEHGNFMKKIIKPELISDSYFYKANPFIHGSVMFKRSILDEISLWYNQDMLYMEDYDFFWRISKKFKCANIQLALYKWRHHNNSISSKRIEVQVENVFLRRLLERGDINKLSVNELSNNQKRVLKAKIENNKMHLKLKNNEQVNACRGYLKSAFFYLSVKSLLFCILALFTPNLLINLIDGD